MKPKINQLINKSVVRLKRGSPTVLTCLGVAGVVATPYSGNPSRLRDTEGTIGQHQ